MSQKEHIVVQKTATYYVLGDLLSAKTIWYVLHGYGYSAEFFIKKFECLLNDKVAFVAPEGLSRFYLEGVEGRVGASWMTKIDREHEIHDYISYLNQLYDRINQQNSAAKVNLLGFSQGGATLCRWVSNGCLKHDHFILWSSGFTEDMDFEKTKDSEVHYLFGNKDQYINPERIEQQKTIMDKSSKPINIIQFEGGHDIPEAILIEQNKNNNW